MFIFIFTEKQYSQDTIFCSNVNANATEEDLKGLFGAIGIIKVNPFTVIIISYSVVTSKCKKTEILQTNTEKFHMEKQN